MRLHTQKNVQIRSCNQKKLKDKHTQTHSTSRSHLSSRLPSYITSSFSFSHYSPLLHPLTLFLLHYIYILLFISSCPLLFSPLLFSIHLPFSLLLHFSSPSISFSLSSSLINPSSFFSLFSFLSSPQILLPSLFYSSPLFLFSFPPFSLLPSSLNLTRGDQDE